MGTKRKEREGEEVLNVEEEHHGSTLFVTSLPYTLTSVDLQTLFSDHAPVRQAFVVLDRETKASKGVGYVSFAVKEDAERLVEELKGGVEVLGRKVRVQWPGSRAEQEAKAASKAATPSKPKIARPAKPAKSAASQTDKDAGRTIVISGLPAALTSKELWKKARKQQGAEKVVFPLPSASASGSGLGKTHDGAVGEKADEEQPSEEGVAHVIYDTPSHALAAVSALHAHTFKGSLLSVVLKKRLDASLRLPATATSGTDGVEGTAGGGKAAPNRAGRLIVRNLPFHITPQELRAIFLPYGSVYSVEIPTIPNPPHGQDERLAKEGAEGKEKKERPLRTRGFGFVWMLTKAEAEKAVEGVNGRVLGEGKGREGRKVAVDWAVSKERWEKVEVAEEVVADGADGAEEKEDEEMADAEAEAEEEEDESADEDVDQGAGVHEEDDEDEDDEDEEDNDDEDAEEGEEDEDEPKARPLLPQTDVGTTLFVRNIPFEATEDDLRTTFRAFGPLRYARITLDPDTGRSRGTGFVCFWNKPDADLAIADAELLASEAGPSALPKGKEKRQNPFAVQSLLTPDPSSSLARNLVLQGRTLSVVRAVPRDDATKLKEDGEKRREKEDKRHLYLMREGVIFPNAPASSTISSEELNRRVASFNTRRTLLRSNPSLYISKTRLSVRQIPTFATERTLKRLAIHAVRAFQDEVKSGARDALARDELDDDTAPSSGSQKKRGERQTAVVQAKLVRQAERVDPFSGKGKSKGYGFLELRRHADALRVLRWANNNPEVVPLMSGWWKEELEENLEKVDEQLKAEKEREKKEDLNDRIRKMKQRVKVLADGAKKGNMSEEKESKGLILEFSIENVQVVKRRQELVEGSRERAKNIRSDVGEIPDERPRKRQKTAKPSTKEIPEAATSERKGKEKHAKGRAEASEHDTSAGKSLGALIGKKRKERKGKKAARG
ncbi:hypothetical protein CALVIDRAFT_512877 [Calocera viscosa TUFC12733]|uniref:RRM domain-containing protein n=1 Tax=Calocera viscosa (strain TUFC12733) TaxID=1330018 RepID=A0A167NHA3_CALVF|nr:hypothetical protein CALVIDRAFT_512877 [Calocera viscosa TUFC12733]